MTVDTKLPAKNSLGLNYFKTFSLSLACLSLGLCIAVIGPTIPTLAYNLQVHIKSLSFILLSRAAGYLFGSIVGGIIYGKFDPHLMIFLALVLTAVGTVIIPYLNLVVYVAIAISTVGVSMGFLDTAGNVMCLQIWGEKAAPFLQAFHFSFALGTTMAPLLAMPFIMEVNADIQNSTYNESTAVSIYTTTPFEKFYDVSYIFITCASITFVGGLLFLYLACFHHGSSTSNRTETVEEEGSAFRVKMLVLLFLFFLVYVGAEVTFGVYIYTFAISSEKHYSKSQASLLNSLFWGSFAVGRFIAIPISKYFSPAKVLQVNLVGTFISAITLACFPFYAQTLDFFFWVAVVVYGVSMASIFPTGITWAEQYITVTGKAAMVLVVGGATGEMLCPFIAGQLIEADPMYLMYFAIACACISIVNYLLLVCLARSKGKRLQNGNVTEIGMQDEKIKEECESLNKANAEAEEK